MARRYLGDGVFVNDDGHMLTLTTTDGFHVTNTVHLVPGVLDALLKYLGAKRTAEDPDSD